MWARPVINNIKGRLILSADAMHQVKKSLTNKTYKQRSNFLTWKGTYSYNIFLQGTINVTGIKCMEDVKNVASKVCADFDIEPSLVKSKFVIDASTASGDFNMRLDLTSIQQYVTLHLSDLFTTKYNRGIFCSLYCRSIRGATCILFASGKVNILGAKCSRQLEDVVDDLIAVVENAMRNTPKRTISFFVI